MTPPAAAMAPQLHLRETAICAYRRFATFNRTAVRGVPHPQPLTIRHSPFVLVDQPRYSADRGDRALGRVRWVGVDRWVLHRMPGARV